MRVSSPTRAEFLDGVFTSCFAGQVATRFVFDDGEVGALYTMGTDPASGQPCPVLLYIATFPPSTPRPGVRDFGVDYWQQPVATAAEAAELLACFDRAAAAHFRASCRF
jgi:hypothetical protein